MFQAQVDQPVEGGVFEISSFQNLLPVHGLVIVADHILDNRVVGIVRLDDHFSPFIFPACPAAYLGHQLKTPFVGSEIGETDHIIGIHDAHHTHMVEIQSFGYHLRSYKDIDALFFKITDNALIGMFRTGSVEIHPPDAGIREINGQFVFNFFCSETLHPDLCAAA